MRNALCAGPSYVLPCLLVIVALAAIRMTTFPALGASDATSSAQAVAPGKYLSEGTNPSGTTYRGTATIEKRGDRYKITWKIKADTFYGIGTLSAGKFKVRWGDSPSSLDKDAVYLIKENGVLEGVWVDRQGTGTDTLTPME